MKKHIKLNLSDIDNTVKVTRALSSTTRVEILQILLKRSCNITELAEKLKLPISTTANHVRELEEANLISTTERPGLRGAQKVSGIAFDDIQIACTLDHIESDKNIYKVPMSIGNYFDFNIKAPCGLVSDKSYIGVEDNPAIFYNNERNKAQLLWFYSGYIEYRFPLENYNNEIIEELNFSFELCSEAPGYNNYWPSDIELYIDDKYCGLITSQGDYGGSRGILNPEWWSDSKTQFGLLHNLNISNYSTHIDDAKVSSMNLKNLDLDKNYISLKFRISEGAENLGGINLFGELFGNHAQGILLEIITRDK